MNYLQKKKLAFMSIVNRVKGFIRTITGTLPLTLEGCVDEESIIDYTLYGQSVQNGTPTPEMPVEVESVGEKTRNIWYPSVDALKSNGITCTRNNDNTYTVNGTATADYYFHIGKITIEVGTTYYLSGGTSQAPIAFQLREGSTGVSTLHNHGGITTFSPTGEHSIDIINCVIVVRSGVEVNNVIVKPMISLENTDEYEPYGYKIPIKVSGKNLLSPQKWVSGEHLDGIIAHPNVNYITSIGENYIEANLAAWKGVASEKFEYAKVNTVGFKINKNQVVDDYTIYYIGLQGYDVDGKKTVFRQLSTSVVADKEYVFKKNNGNFVLGLSTTSVRLCILSRSQAITGLRVYDFYSTNDTATDYEPYHEPITTNIYLDEPLGAGQSINYKKDGLPPIPTFKGTSIISADTTIQPSNVEITYYSNVKE